MSKPRPRLLEQWHRSKEDARAGAELSKALVKSPGPFLRAMREDPESFSGWLEKLHEHTFAAAPPRDEVERELHAAYYARLRELMAASVQPHVGTGLHEQATRVLDALNRSACDPIHSTRNEEHNGTALPGIG